LSQIYPQKKDAGMEQNRASEAIIPTSTREPPIADVTRYKGMKTESKPNAIS
jgi:hypothetical protein